MKRSRRPVYVETLIRATPDELWHRTQELRAHQRWDLRFQRITPAADRSDLTESPELRAGSAHAPSMPSDTTHPARPGEVRRFRYAVRLLPGVVISGLGVTAGERRRPDGTGTSALRFGSAHPLSPIRSGAGYWRYIPREHGISFLTGYDYVPGWGRFGGVADRIFRPLMGWATAWSFDRLRLWLETGRTPEHTRRQALGEVVARLAAPVLALPYDSVLAAVLIVLGVALPPLPGTPAARRCLRRPPGGGAARAPALLSRLTQITRLEQS